MPYQETRDKIFLEYLDCGCNFAEVEARFEQKLEESQRTQVRWGFRNDQWLVKHHGERKANKIMARKKDLGLNLGFTCIFAVTNPCTTQSSLHVRSSNHRPIIQSSRPRTIPDPEFPGEDEHLYFVMVELNLDDIRELKRVTSLELQGTLDPAGLKAFVEAQSAFGF